MKALLCILLLSAAAFGQIANTRRQDREEHECKASLFPGVLLAPSGDQTIIGNHSLIFDGSQFQIQLNPGPGLVPFVIHSPFANGIELYTHADAGFRAPYITFYKSRGTEASPTPATFTGYEADSIGGINFGGWDGSSYVVAASILTQSDENWTPTSHGGHISIYGTNNNGGHGQQFAQFGGVDPNGRGDGNIIFQRPLTFFGNGSGDPGIFPATRLLAVRTADNLQDAALSAGSFIETRPHTPATAFEPCDAGTIAWDPNFVYVCVAPNTWRRSALAAW